MKQAVVHVLILLSLCVPQNDRVLNRNESFSFTVYARTAYNNSGLRLVKGHTYSFTATGNWKDGSCRTCDADGFTSDQCNSSSSATTAFLRINEGIRRDNNQHWFCLIGEIFDQTSNVFDNALHDQQFKIGSSRTVKPNVTGKLVCFANDVITAYGNNSGSVRVTVRRID